MPDLLLPPAVPGWRVRIDELRDTPAARAFGVFVAVAVVAGVAFFALRSPPPPEIQLPKAVARTSGTDASLVQAPPTSAVVHVAGAVVHPGIHRLESAARVADAIDAAGGATADADLDGVNLAAKVSDGDRIYVPHKGEVAPGGVIQAGAGAGSATKPAAPLDLNRATEAELDALPGIGPATAHAIVEYRQQHGRFRSVDDLLEIRGIGQAKLAALRSRVRV